MSILIGLIIAIVVIGGVFMYFFLQDDDRQFGEQLQNFRKKTTEEQPKPTARLADTLFVQGLKAVDFDNKHLAAIADQMHEKIIGLENLVNGIIINMFCGGHILVEGVPGLAKTKTIATFSEIMDMDFVRVQFTPDMLPSDLIGVEIYNSKTKTFEVQSGPIFGNIILADEINRTTPKVQSALLEAMQEKQVTIAGETKKLPEPFMVLATQNPLEQEGTYPLPEAQLDRFLFKILLHYPTMTQEKKILDMVEHEASISLKKAMTHKTFATLMKQRDNIKISDDVKNYITRLVEKTREPHDYLQYGASPRGSIGLMQAAKGVALAEDRDYVNHEDVQRVSLSVLRHRIAITYDAKLDGYTADDILLELLTDVSLG